MAIRTETLGLSSLTDRMRVAEVQRYIVWEREYKDSRLSAPSYKLTVSYPNSTDDQPLSVDIALKRTISLHSSRIGRNQPIEWPVFYTQLSFSPYHRDAEAVAQHGFIFWDYPDNIRLLQRADFNYHLAYYVSNDPESHLVSLQQVSKLHRNNDNSRRTYMTYGRGVSEAFFPQTVDIINLLHLYSGQNISASEIYAAPLRPPIE
jgi:hypothetical protein